MYEHYPHRFPTTPRIAPSQTVKFELSNKKLQGKATSYSNYQNETVEVTANGKNYLCRWGGKSLGWIAQN